MSHEWTESMSDRIPVGLQELPRFQEMIFEDFSGFILVENIYEEVVLQSVMKDIMMGEWTRWSWTGSTGQPETQR